MYTRSLPPQPESALFDNLDGVAYVHNQDLEPGAVSVDERTINLCASLALLDEISEKQTLKRNAEHGTNSGLVAGLATQIKARHDQAFAHFASAYGAYGMLEQGANPETTFQQTWNAFGEFSRHYAGEKHRSERATYRAKLVSRFALQQEIVEEIVTVPEVTLDKRETPYPKYLGEAKGDDREETLTTRQKLIGLRDDKRANFLPTTHREKNSALELLNYLDYTKNPKGAIIYLEQIYAHQVNLPTAQAEAKNRLAYQAGLAPDQLDRYALRTRGQDIAQDTIRSIVQEWGDYVMNAQYSVNKLTDLSEILDEYVNPNLSLQVVLDEHAGKDIDVDPLLRFLDLSAFRETGKLPEPLFDPLRTREIRAVGFDHKNKLVTDVYINPADKTHIGDQLHYKVASLTLGQVKKQMREASMDSLSRQLFFQNILRKVSEDETYGIYATWAIQEAA